MHACMHSFLYVCMDVRMFVCVYACINVCMHIFSLNFRVYMLGRWVFEFRAARFRLIEAVGVSELCLERTCGVTDANQAWLCLQMFTLFVSKVQSAQA